MIIIMVLLVIILWVISPWMLVWAINTLFHTGYAIGTFWEWLAGLLLAAPFFAPSRSSK